MRRRLPERNPFQGGSKNYRELGKRDEKKSEQVRKEKGEVREGGEFCFYKGKVGKML